MARELRNILINTIHDRQLLEFANRFLYGSLLDIGCGVKPYKEILAPHITEHVGLDHPGSIHGKENVDMFGSAYHIPVKDATYDSAISTAVLEHIEEPEDAVRECYRILKPRGVAIYSVPFIWHLHEEPFDYFRFSKYGLKHIFEKVGFEIIEIKALSGFWVTFGQLFVYNLYRFNRGPLRWFRIVDIIGLILQALSYVIDRIDKTEQWTWMYMIVVRKP